MFSKQICILKGNFYTTLDKFLTMPEARSTYGILLWLGDWFESMINGYSETEKIHENTIHEKYIHIRAGSFGEIYEKYRFGNHLKTKYLNLFWEVLMRVVVHLSIYTIYLLFRFHLHRQHYRNSNTEQEMGYGLLSLSLRSLNYGVLNKYLKQVTKNYLCTCLCIF